MTEIRMTDPKLSVLSSLFTSATENASEAMCKWTNGQITLSLEGLREIALEQVQAELDVGDDLLTMVVLSFEGDLGGQLILTFDEQNGRQLAASLLGREKNTDPEWSEMEQSALKETGNILACSYMRVLTDIIDTNLVPSPPYFIQDYGASVLQQAVMTQAMVSDRILICHTIFRQDDEELKWNIFFMPTEELSTTLEKAFEAIT